MSSPRRKSGRVLLSATSASCASSSMVNPAVVSTAAAERYSIGNSSRATTYTVGSHFNRAAVDRIAPANN